MEINEMKRPTGLIYDFEDDVQDKRTLLNYLHQLERENQQRLF